MTICIDVGLTTDTSTIDLVFPNGIAKGGRVRLNLLRPVACDADLEAYAQQASSRNAANTRETRSRTRKTHVLQRVRVSSGAEPCDADPKHAFQAESRSLDQVSSRKEPGDSDSEGFDALSDGGVASSCPSSPGTAPSQGQATRLVSSGATVTESWLRDKIQDPSANGNPVPAPAPAEGQVPTDSCPTSESAGSPQKDDPRASLIPVVHPATVAQAEKLPPESREAFIASAAKVLFRCLECSHSTFDKAEALSHLAEHTASKKAKPVDSPDAETQESQDPPVPKASLEPSPQKRPVRKPAKKSAKKPARKTTKKPTKRTRYRSDSPESEIVDTPPSSPDPPRAKKKSAKSSAPKKRVTKKTGDERFECDQCHRTFSSKSNLRTHQKDLHSSVTYACDLCPMVTNSRHSLRQHVNTIHQRTTVATECEHCKKRFASKAQLQRHTAVMHMGDGACLAEGTNPFPSLKVFRCKECPHVTFSPYRSKAHAVTHTGVMPFQCSQCDKSFVFRDVLNRHVLLKHNDGKEKRCPHCKRRFVSDSRYKVHVRLHERNGGFVCKECGQLFESKGFLDYHAQRHSTNEEPSTCQVCGMTFKNVRAKAIHTNHRHPEVSSSSSLAIVRSMNYPHGCDQCPVRFKTVVELQAHQTYNHSPNQGSASNTSSAPPKDRFKCTICQKGFPWSFSLRLHMRTHTGERPFVCQYCNKTFNVHKALKQHIMSMHTKDFKLHCLLCGRGVVNNTKLKQHLRQSHKAVEKPSLPAPLRNKAQGKPRAGKVLPQNVQQHQVQQQQQQQ
ncbi:unnamed protein product, partial [Ixodes pacificus]